MIEKTKQTMSMRIRRTIMIVGGISFLCIVGIVIVGVY